MALAIVRTRASVGIAAPLVTVEVHLSAGLPAFNIVGLPDSAVRESRDRVRSALINAQFEFPLQRITVNLAPADLPKDGGRFDLAIAIGIIAAIDQHHPLVHLSDFELLGELALNGELRGVPGVLPAVMAAASSGRRMIVPTENAAEAAIAQHAQSLAATNLLEVCALLSQNPVTHQFVTRPEMVTRSASERLRLSDIRGQVQAKRALVLAAAGGHHLLLRGPPGTGKTMLARRLPGLLPPLTTEEALEVVAVHSVAGQRDSLSLLGERPFREPHHTASAVAMIGGGSSPRPGEVSLAHRGILFLDEFPEFDRRVLEVLREPLESGEVRIARARSSVCFPARFQLVAAMNPCPAGLDCKGSRQCRCTAEQSMRYRQKLSAPLLDRIDLQVEVPSVPIAELHQLATTADDDFCEAIHAARIRQQTRNGALNRDLGTDALLQLGVDAEGLRLLVRAAEQLGLSARGHQRVLRVARTIADLAGEEQIKVLHLSEALSYRGFER